MLPTEYTPHSVLLKRSVSLPTNGRDFLFPSSVGRDLFLSKDWAIDIGGRHVREHHIRRVRRSRAADGDVPQVRDIHLPDDGFRAWWSSARAGQLRGLDGHT